MPATSLYKKWATIVAERDDGYFCAYCGIELVPPGIKPGTEPFYVATIPVSMIDGDRRYTKVYHLLRDGIALGSIDHVQPVSKGGSTSLDNFLLACRSCNSSKKHHAVEAFIRGDHRNSNERQDDSSRRS